jgi:hypothetical protein
MKTQLSFALAAALTLIGCTEVAKPQPSAHFGEAVTHNIAVQTVNPNAPKDKRPIAYDAQHAALAQARYEADQVKVPADAAASQVAAGSSGGNMGGSH